MQGSDIVSSSSWANLLWEFKMDKSSAASIECPCGRYILICGECDMCIRLMRFC